MNQSTYIKNLEIFILLFHKKLFIELFYKVNFFVPMQKMIERLENCAILYREDL